jgi:putative restriction endonuclease
METFDNNPSWESRALQIWQILIGKAHNRQTITYGMLASLLGYGGAGVMASPLDRIMCFCIQNQLPPLTVLVVNSDTGSPGEGLLLKYNENVERERVFNEVNPIKLDQIRPPIVYYEMSS